MAATTEAPYEVLRGFLSADQCASLMESVDMFKNQHHNRANLWRHATYPSDVAENRVSWAFAIKPVPASEPEPEPGKVELPYVQPDAGSVLAEVTSRVHALLGSPQGRILFNVQHYSAGNKPILPHHDGEVFNRSFEGKVLTALYPRRVALLCTLMHAVGGGTRLHFKDGSEEVVHCKCGDLLIFDNVNALHSVDSFEPLPPEQRPDGREGGLVRCIVGWRCLDDQTVLLQTSSTGISATSAITTEQQSQQEAAAEAPSEGEQFQPVTYDEACERHRAFLEAGGGWENRRVDLNLLGLLQ